MVPGEAFCVQLWPEPLCSIKCQSNVGSDLILPCIMSGSSVRGAIVLSGARLWVSIPVADLEPTEW